MVASRFFAASVCWDVSWTAGAIAALAGTVLARGRAREGSDIPELSSVA